MEKTTKLINLTSKNDIGIRINNIFLQSSGISAGAKTTIYEDEFYLYTKTKKHQKIKPMEKKSKKTAD